MSLQDDPHLESRWTQALRRLLLRRILLLLLLPGLLTRCRRRSQHVLCTTLLGHHLLLLSHDPRFVLDGESERQTDEQCGCGDYPHEFAREERTGEGV